MRLRPLLKTLATELHVKYGLAPSLAGAMLRYGSIPGQGLPRGRIRQPVQEEGNYRVSQGRPRGVLSYTEERDGGAYQQGLRRLRQPLL